LCWGLTSLPIFMSDLNQRDITSNWTYQTAMKALRRRISNPNKQTWWKVDHFNTVFISEMLKIEMIKMMMGSNKAWIKWQLTICSSNRTPRGWSWEECRSVNYNESNSQPLVIYIVYWPRCDQKHYTNILNKCCENASSMAQASHHTKLKLLYNRIKHSTYTYAIGNGKVHLKH